MLLGPPHCQISAGVDAPVAPILTTHLFSYCLGLLGAMGLTERGNKTVSFVGT